MTAKLREADRGLREAVETYNGRVDSMGRWYVTDPDTEEPEEVNLPSIDMEDIPAHEAWLATHRETIEHMLGEEWWEKEPGEVDIYVPGEREVRD